MNKNVMAEDLIRKCIGLQKLVITAQEHDIGEGYTDSNLMEYFAEIQENSLESNSEVSRKVADYCQLFMGEEKYKSVSLGQIQEIYELLIRVHPLDISFYESLAYFLNNVMGQPEKGKRILLSGIETIEREIQQLRNNLMILIRTTVFPDSIYFKLPNAEIQELLEYYAEILVIKYYKE